CSTKEEMLDAAATFNTDLYSSDAMDPQAIFDLLYALPASIRLSDTAADSVFPSITFDNFSHVLDNWSLGKDDLPYQLFRLIVLHPGCHEITFATFHNALCFANIPPS
ncbi:hypothetical protein BD408DRAFT_349997, partial [Parasitella parasitica]